MDMQSRWPKVVVFVLAVFAFAAAGCSGSATVGQTQTSTQTEPTAERPARPAVTPGPDISAAQEEAAENGMIETYNALVQAYAEASMPPVDPQHPVIQARTSGAANRQITRYYQSLLDSGYAETNSRDERVIVEVIVDSATSGRIRECSVLASDLVDLETGDIEDSVGEVAFTDNVYLLEDGIWKLDHWTDSFSIETLADCPVGMRDDPRINA